MLAQIIPLFGCLQIFVKKNGALGVIKVKNTDMSNKKYQFIFPCYFLCQTTNFYLKC